MHHGGQVAAVVQDHVEWFAVGEVDRLIDAPVILFIGFALPGEDGNTRFRDCRCRVVLSGELVATTPLNVGPQVNERFDEHGRLDGHVQAASDLRALQRFALAILLANGHQAGHLVLCEHDLATTPIGKRNVFDLVRDLSFNLRHS